MNIASAAKAGFSVAQMQRGSSGDGVSIVALAETHGEDHSRTLANRETERAQQLESALRHMKEMQNQRIMKEKMESLALLVAGVAHEVNTPIGSVKSAADVSNHCIGKILAALEASSAWNELQENKSFQEAVILLRENNRLTAMASERLVAVVRNLKNFARLDEAEFQKADLHEGLNSTLALIHHKLKDKADVIKEYGDIPAIACYPNQLNQVFMNLLVNAAQSIENKGTITIKTSSDKENVCIQITDTGRGISPDDINWIFDPGFTTKGVGVGTGLGLSTSYRVIEKHKGQIEVESTPGEGSVFTLVLPIGSVEREEHWRGPERFTDTIYA